MKMRWFLLVSGFSVAVAFFGGSASSQTVVTFDDIAIPATNDSIRMTNGYQGLVWSNFFALNVASEIRMFGVTNGYFYGMVSPSNVALNASGNPAEIDSTGTNFNFLSAYLTGAWNSNLNIQVDGFNGSTLSYATTVVANATSPTLFTFNYMNIDRLYFSSSGGQPVGWFGEGENFAMDNLTFEFIPEPSSLLLTSLGLLSLWAVAKRRWR